MAVKDRGVIVYAKNLTVKVIPPYNPLDILVDEAGNYYLVTTSFSAIDEAVVEYGLASGVDKMLEMLQKGEMRVAKEYSVATVIGDVIQYPRAGLRVKRVGSFEEVTSKYADKYAIVTPFGKYEPFTKYIGGHKVFGLSHVFVLAMTGSGKTLLELAHIYELLMKKRNGEIPPEYGDVKIVVLDYHGEFKPAEEDFKNMGFDTLYLERPYINLCNSPPDVLAAIFGILPVMERANKMMHYMQLVTQLACSAPEELKSKYEDPVDLIGEIMNVIIHLPFYHKNCREGTLTGGKRYKECIVHEYVKRMLGEKYDLYLELLEERDADSVLSLARYSFKELEAYRGMITLGQDIPIDKYDATFINLSIALSNSNYAIPIAIYVISRVMASPHTVVLFVEEAPALARHYAILNMLMIVAEQGRKFGKFEFIVSQEPLDMMSNAELIVGRITSDKYIEQVLARSPNMSSVLASLLPILRPWEFLRIGQTTLPIRLTKKVVRHRASEI